MAQLPPKTPNMAPNWPNSFPHHQKMPPIPATFIPTTTQQPPEPPPSAQQQPSWVDEFLDFSSARRAVHRRSISESIAFLETHLILEECRNSNSSAVNLHNAAANNGFDRLDDEQLMSMFSDDMSMGVQQSVISTSNPSTSSDQNSNAGEKRALDNQQDQKIEPKYEPGEVESSCQLSDAEAAMNGGAVSGGDCISIDPKRVKRILANRQSAQRSRVRKLQYISKLERSVTTLQTEVSTLSPRVAFLDQQRLILNIDNSAIKQRIAALAQDKIFKDAHQEALKKEIERLRQVYHQQSLRKMNNQNNTPPTTSAQQQQQPMSLLNSTDTIGGCNDREVELLD